MSGGHFNYLQYQFEDVADEIGQLILKNEQDFSEETLDKFITASKYCRIASKMVQEIDFLVCGDTGEETFLKSWEGQNLPIEIPENTWFTGKLFDEIQELKDKLAKLEGKNE